MSINFSEMSKILRRGANYLSSILADPEVQKILGASLTSALAAGIVVDQLDKSEAAQDAEEKAQAYTEKIGKQQAAIEILEEKAKLSQERQDYLVELNRQLLAQQQINVQTGDSDEEA